MLNDFAKDRHPGIVGVEVLTCEADLVTGRLPVTHELVAGTGFLWSPVIVTLADWLCACGMGPNLPEDVSFTTIEMKANFLGTVREGGSVVGRAGRSTAAAQRRSGTSRSPTSPTRRPSRSSAAPRWSCRGRSSNPRFWYDKRQLQPLGEEPLMTTAIEVHGACDARFSRVRDAFADNFSKRGEVGASLAVMLDGRMVVDLWGGSADAAGNRPWESDTIVNTFSTTKGITAICAHRLVEQGLLDIDAPVATYWPEFAQAGKEKLPVRYLLSHRAGLPALHEFLPAGTGYSNWDLFVERLAATEPW